MRRSLVLPLIGIVAMALAVLWAVLGGRAVMPSYLAGWLLWSGLPFGALTVLLVLEIGGGGSTAFALAPLFRRLALGVPLAALLFIPVLARLHAVYPWVAGAGPGAGFGRDWLHAGFFIGRSVAYLIVLSGLALLFARDRPLGERRVAALFTLFVVALVGTLAATDWVMSLDPDLHSGEFGLLQMSAQCAVATTGAVLLGTLAGALPARPAVHLLAGVSAVWLYLHFMHFLVIWSGDLPQEAAWYLSRDADGGRVVEWLAFIGGFIVPTAMLLVPRELQARGIALAAALALLAHMAEALWFVTPALRHHFALRAPDALMLIGLGGLLLVLARAPLPAVSRGAT